MLSRDRKCICTGRQNAKKDCHRARYARSTTAGVSESGGGISYNLWPTGELGRAASVGPDVTLFEVGRSFYVA